MQTKLHNNMANGLINTTWIKKLVKLGDRTRITEHVVFTLIPQPWKRAGSNERHITVIDSGQFSMKNVAQLTKVNPICRYVLPTHT